MKCAVLQTHPDPFGSYVEEGAALLGRLIEGAHLGERCGRLFFVAEIAPALADALGNWGADLADLEPEDVL